MATASATSDQRRLNERVSDSQCPCTCFQVRVNFDIKSLDTEVVISSILKYNEHPMKGH